MYYELYSLQTSSIILQYIENVTDRGNGGQPACPEEWKKCKEEHE
jgi:hypothetical protein